MVSLTDAIATELLLFILDVLDGKEEDIVDWEMIGYSSTKVRSIKNGWNKMSPRNKEKFKRILKLKIINSGKYGRDSNILDNDKRKLINMKNEFLFSRILLTNSKKNYASIQLLKEDQIAPKQK